MRRSRRWYLAAGGLLVSLILLMALFAPQLTQVSPDYWDARPSILDGRPPFPPSAEHPLGTDQYGRDVWSRIAYGARWSLLFAFLIMAARLAVATPAAFLAAFGPRRIGWLVEKLYVMTSAIPPLLIYILLLSFRHLRLIGLWPSTVVTISLLTLVEWPRVAVVLKGRLTSLLAEPFVEGAVAVGNSRWQIFKNHLFPHLWPVLLHLFAAEMARALVVIAQLAIFGIIVGGGVLNIVDNGKGGDRYVVTSGVPEWGTLLGDGRYDVLAHPWIPFPPAFAFLVAVTGFSLLSQGLETVTFSVQELKDATTGKLSRRWRWALPALLAAGVLWHYQGLPWTREAGIRDLAARQGAALTAGNLEAYLATLRSESAGNVDDLRRWAADLLEDDAIEMVGVEPGALQIEGRTARATWRVVVGKRHDPPFELTRQTTLVRRWGRWYEAGAPFREVRGFHVDVTADFDPIDPRQEAIPPRWNVQYIATAADHAFRSVEGLFPDREGAPRPQVKLYPTLNALQQVAGDNLSPNATIWYTSGEPIRLAPEFMRGSKRWDVIRSLSFEMLKFLTETRLGSKQVSPLILGGWDLHQDTERTVYRIDVTRLAGAPFYSLEELFATNVDALPQERQYLFMTQAALLAEYTEARLPERPVKADGLADLARRLGTTPEQLSREYHAHLVARVKSESLAAIPAARGRIPAGLEDAVATQTQATFLDFQEERDLIIVQALAEGARPGVVKQTWTRRGDTWVLLGTAQP